MYVSIFTKIYIQIWSIYVRTQIRNGAKNLFVLVGVHGPLHGGVELGAAVCKKLIHQCSLA